MDFRCMRMAEKDSMFGRLPPELINQVLGYLPIQDRLECRLVCSRWNALTTLGLKFLVHVNDETLSAAMKCNQRVETLYARDLYKSLPLSYKRKVIRNFKFLRRMFFGPNITSSNMKKLLEQVQIVDTIGFSYEHPPSFDGLHFNHLTCLQFQKIKLKMSQAVSFKKLLSNVHFPVLKRFNLIQIDVTDFRVYLAIHLFVVNHAKTLKNLIINIAPENVKTSPVDERFRNLYESCAIYQDVTSRLSQVKLDTVWINSCNYEGLSPWNLSCKLVSEQKSLECLLLDGMWFSQAIQRSDELNIDEVLERNRNSLRRLKLPVTNLDGRLICRCNGLEEIGVYIPYEQLKAFGMTGTEGSVRNYQLLPKTLRMIDMHIPMDRSDVTWVMQHIPIEDFVFEGLRHQHWTMEMFASLWTNPALVNFRAYTRMNHADVKRINEFVTESAGISGVVEFNTSTRFALVDVTFDRSVYGKIKSSSKRASNSASSDSNANNHFNTS